MQNSIEIITENFISKIYYGKVHVKFPSGNEKLFEGNVKSYTADIKINSYRFISKILKKRSVGFAEAYIDGDFTTSNLTNLLLLAFKNEKYLTS